MATSKSACAFCICSQHVRQYAQAYSSDRRSQWVGAKSSSRKLARNRRRDTAGECRGWGERRGGGGSPPPPPPGKNVLRTPKKQEENTVQKKIHVVPGSGRSPHFFCDR